MNRYLTMHRGTVVFKISSGGPERAVHICEFSRHINNLNHAWLCEVQVAFKAQPAYPIPSIFPPVTPSLPCIGTFQASKCLLCPADAERNPRRGADVLRRPLLSSKSLLLEGTTPVTC